MLKREFVTSRHHCGLKKGDMILGRLFSKVVDSNSIATVLFVKPLDARCW